MCRYYLNHEIGVIHHATPQRTRAQNEAQWRLYAPTTPPNKLIDVEWRGWRLVVTAPSPFAPAMMHASMDGHGKSLAASVHSVNEAREWLRQMDAQFGLGKKALS